MDPVHLHLLLNHIPIIGLAIATLSLLLALLARNSGAVKIALALVLLTSASALPVYLTGENAYKPVRRHYADAVGMEWLDTHLERADRTIFLFALPAALSLAGLLLPRPFSKWNTPLAWAALLAATASFAAAIWVAEAGGQIRHLEIRKSQMGD